MKKQWKNDWITLILALILSLAGVISITSSEGGFNPGMPGLAVKQLIFLAVGLILYVIFSFINYRIYSKLTAPVYILTILILVTVLVIGAVRGGSERWILIGSYQIQSSEHAKLLMIIVLARVFTRLKGEFSDRFVFLTALVLTIPVLLLIAAEPDLGMTMIFFMIFLLMSFISKISWRIPVTFILLVTLLIPAAWPVMKDYQKNRIMSFVNPSLDPRGKGYQSNQSKIAIGSGGISGKGLFKGTQNKLDFIPSQSTDFIFSIVGEEGGFIFSALVVILYMFMFLRLGSVAIRAPDQFSSMIIWGICTMLFLQTFVNIGMTIGIMPVTGTPLPFMSSGVNSLLLNFTCLGVANNIHRDIQIETRPDGEFVKLIW